MIRNSRSSTTREVKLLELREREREREGERERERVFRSYDKDAESVHREVRTREV
jgi:hypothetical protein